MEPTARKKFNSLQAVRGFAACIVVFHHSFRAISVNAPADLAAASPIHVSPSLVELAAFGVDLFFVLSGFLMVYISGPYARGEKTVIDFFIHRIIRIWPLYVLATAFYLAMQIFGSGTHGTGLPFDASLIRLASLFFVPSFNVTGALQPIVGVGWTLNYEALFYVVFSLAILVQPKHILAALAGLLSILFIAGWLANDASVASTFLRNPIIFEFLFGAIIATFYSKGLIRIDGFLAIAIGFALLLAFINFSNDDPWRFLLRGAPASIIFIGFLMLEDRVKWPYWVITLGNASYSIYLIHLAVVQKISKYLFPVLSRAIPSAAAEVTALIAIVLSIGAGLLVHFYIERPVLTSLAAAYSNFSSRKYDEKRV